VVSVGMRGAELPGVLLMKLEMDKHTALARDEYIYSVRLVVSGGDLMRAKLIPSDQEFFRQCEAGSVADQLLGLQHLAFRIEQSNPACSARRAAMKSGANDQWIEDIARAIETEKDERGEPFIVRFPWPLSDAQERLVRSLGVTPVYEAVPASELAEIAREVVA
jgi:hypothetical protein